MTKIDTTLLASRLDLLDTRCMLLLGAVGECKRALASARAQVKDEEVKHPNSMLLAAHLMYAGKLNARLARLCRLHSLACLQNWKLEQRYIKALRA
jgi:hypothetical protein